MSGRLRRTGWLRRLTPLRRGPAPVRTPMLVSRPTVRAEERTARRAVVARSRGRCEVCPGDHPAVDWSHRKRRSQGGPWCASNGLHVCRQAHQLIDDPTQLTPRYCGWAVKSYQDPRSVPCYLPRHGWVLLLPDGSVTPCRPPDDTETAA